MASPHSRGTSLYLSDDILDRIEKERDRLADGDRRRRPSRSLAVALLLERALDTSAR